MLINNSDCMSFVKKNLIMETFSAIFYSHCVCVFYSQEDHDGTRKGRDRICRNNTNPLISSYVNIDKEPIFYKTSR